MDKEIVTLFTQFLKSRENDYTHFTMGHITQNILNVHSYYRAYLLDEKYKQFMRNRLNYWVNVFIECEYILLYGDNFILANVPKSAEISEIYADLEQIRRIRKATGTAHFPAFP